MLVYPSMFGKILLTTAVILAAYLVIRARIRQGREPAARVPARTHPPLVPAGLLKTVAYALVVGMVSGSLLWLYLGYDAGREVMTVRIINAHTGEVTTYQARRSEIRERSFTSLDGRPVTLADVDRMEVIAADR